MTLEEKVNQMSQVVGAFFNKDMDITAMGPMADKGFTPENVALSGSILGSMGAETLKKIQKDFVEQHPHHIPMLFMLDVINGFKTIFPIPLGQGATFEPELSEKCAAVAAKEAAVSGLHVTFAPMTDLVRDARWGRVMESTGEDPYLNGLFCAGMVRGFQGDDLKEPYKIASCVKHFAGYGAPTAGRDYNTVELSEHTFRDFYLPSYKAGIDAGAAMVMTSFNTVNGVPATGNKKLMRGILRDEMGFDGVLISDWAAIEEIIYHGYCADREEAAVRSAEAGVDIDMMTGIYCENLCRLVREGKISEDLIDESCMRILELKNKLGLFENPYKDADAEKEKAYNLCPEHRALAKKAAEESFVLLKNDGILPISQDADVVVIGALAEQMRFQGGGSSHINTASFPNALDALRKLGVTVTYAPGYSLKDEENRELEEQALALAAGQKTVLFFGGLTDQYEGEGYDRKSLAMPANQLHLLNKICEVSPNVAVVSFSGAPYDMAFENRVRGILQMYLGGEAVGEACGELLTGRVNPSGKLAESWPYAVEDTPCHGFFATGSDDIEYRESIYVGYRYYDSFGIPVRFPFGFGLSYTTFAYDNLKLSSETYEGGRLQVSLNVTNTGSAAGAEIVELYVENPPADYLRAKKELKGFQKVMLAPGETKRVTMELDERSFSIFDEGRFRLTGGTYRVLIGSSVQDIRLSQTVTVQGEACTRNDRERLSDYFQKDLHGVTREQFAALYGKPLSHFDDRKPGEYSLYDSLNQLAEASPIARMVRKAARPLVYSMFKGIPHDDPQVVMVLMGMENGMIDSVVCQSGGMLPMRVAEAMVLQANGHRGKALRKLIRG